MSSRIEPIAFYDGALEVTISPKRWRAINAAGKLTMNPKHQRDIEQHLCDYANNQMRSAKSPKLRPALELLKNIEAHSEGLAQALNALCGIDPKGLEHADTAIEIGFHRALRTCAGPGGPSFGDPPMTRDGKVDTKNWERRFYDEIVVFREASTIAKLELKNQHGGRSRPTDHQLNRCIDELGAIYQSKGGNFAANKDSEGRWCPFVRWLHALLQELPNEVPKPAIHALGARVGRSLEQHQEIEPSGGDQSAFCSRPDDAAPETSTAR